MSSQAHLEASVWPRWRIVILLFSAIVVSFVDRGNLSVAAVPLMRELRISPPAMGALLSAFFWTYASLQMPAGYLVDRFSPRWLYAVAFLLWSATSAATGLATSVQQIVGLRLLLGVAESVSHPLSLACIKRYFREDEQGLPTGVYVSGMMVGPALGALLGGMILERLGWRWLFVITGLGASIWVIPWLILAPEPELAPKVSTHASQHVAWRGMVADGGFWGLTIGVFFYSYYWYFFLTWLPSYLVMTHNFSFLRMGAYTATALLGMAVASPIGGHLADRLIATSRRPLAIRRAFICTGFLLGSSILLLLNIQSGGPILVVLSCSLTGLGLASANFWALTQAIAPASLVGRVVGYQNTIGNLAGICAPLLTGLLVGQSKNFRSSILFAGLSLWIASAAVFFLVRSDGMRGFQEACPAVRTE
jgi:ACS family D-galactonate transporter-like MFS transporter